MRIIHGVLVVASLLVGRTLPACGGDSPRMRALTAHVRSGDSIVVRFDAPPVGPRARGSVWLTLVPRGSSEDFSGERTVVEEGALDASLPAGDEGTYELRLVDQSPRRLSRVVARVPIVVERPAVARNEAPAWYW
jgi:hypothetical protein